MANILIVDDHKLLVSTLRSVLTRADHFVETAEHGQEALDVLRDASIDLIFLDINMPVMSGLVFMEQFRKIKHRARVIVLTQYDDPSLICHMLLLGINGFLLKSCDVTELELAIHETLENGEYFNELTSDVVARYYARNEAFADLRLSTREMELVVQLSRGASSKEIASALDLSLFTVETYRKTIMRKTRARNVANLISIVARTGLINLPKLT